MDQLEEIKNKIDIVEFINGFVPLKKAGRNFKGLCPFHSEKTPSFIVSPERQIWHCFGGCNDGGDIFSFLMKIENIDFGEAVKELAGRAGVKLAQYQLSEGEKNKQILYEINHLTAEYYHYLLINHPIGKKALDYILGRGISKNSLELFKIGFAPNSWRSLENYLINKKGYRVEDLEKAGLAIKGPNAGFYDRFRSRLIFPLKDQRGNVCGFAGRIIPSGLRPKEDEQEAKYINTPETFIYHKSDLLFGLSEAKEEIKKKDQAIFVEGELDMISSFQAGVKNVLAIKGTALTENQIKLISRFTQKIILALDQDIAGDAAARRGIETAEKEGLMVRVAKLQGGKDPDEIAQKTPLTWREIIKKAQPVYDYLLDSVFTRFNGGTIEGKTKISAEIIPILAKISNEIILNHYVRELASRLQVNEEAIIKEISKIKTNKSSFSAGKTIFSQIKIDKEKSHREVLEEYLLSLVFQSGQWEILKKKKIINLIQTYRFSKILEILGDYLKNYKTINSERLAKMIGPELVETFNKFYLVDLGDLMEDGAKFGEEVEKTIARLEKIDLVEKLIEISGKIKALEKEGELSSEDQKKASKLNEEFRDLTSKLSFFEEK